MLHFEGDKDFSQAPAELYAKLSDPRFVVDCVPDVESVARAEPEIVVCILRPGFTFVRGTLELTIRVADAVSAQSLRWLLHTKGIGTTSDVETALTFTPQNGGTHLHWTADIKELGGLLKAVPKGLVQAA